jgi:hypothetical protein
VTGGWEGELLHWMGLTNPAGKLYSFWSGIGSDIGEVTIVVAVVGLYRKHNCHVKGCWRMGKHPITGTAFTTCLRHHPVIDAKPTVADIADAYHASANTDTPPPSANPDTGDGAVPYA